MKESKSRFVVTKVMGGFKVDYSLKNKGGYVVSPQLMNAAKDLYIKYGLRPEESRINSHFSNIRDWLEESSDNHDYGYMWGRLAD